MKLFRIKLLSSKLKNSPFYEALVAVLPISILILVLNIFLPNPITGYGLVNFIVGNLILIGGMTLYSLGISISLSPIGEKFGEFLTQKKNIFLLLFAGLLLGLIITIAEPDLSVLGEQLGSIKWTLILTISFGVGLFLAFALLKIFLKWDFTVTILVFYGIVFLLAFIAQQTGLSQYIPLSFDSGGVTTGAITVPFILAFGASVAGMVGGKSKDENSFGMIAICSIGPIMMTMLLCLLFKPSVDTSMEYATIDSFSSLLHVYGVNLIKYLKEVAIAIAPISVIFYICNFIWFKIPKIQLTKLSMGLLYTYLGLSLFLTGVNSAYMSTGHFLGNSLALTQHKWVLIPVGALVGLLIVLAEPAVGVLVKQVESISAGTIKQNTMRIALALSMAFAVAFSMARILYGISIWYIIAPGYAIAFILSFFVPKVYTSIAFDSGGVASGPMTATFLLPFAIGAAEAVYSGSTNGVLSYAYGLVGTVALMPLITIQLMGLTAKIIEKRALRKRDMLENLTDEDIIELGE